MRRSALIAFGEVALAATLGCGHSLVVGSKNFTEQILLGEIIALLLEDRGVPVDRRFNLGGSYLCHRALADGELDIYVEYTGTALTAILKEPVLHDREAVYGKVKAEYQSRYGLAWGPPLGFNNTFVLAMRAPHASRLGIRRISDLAAHADSIRTGFGHEFLEREDGLRGLARAYNLDLTIPPRGMELGLIYQALAEEQVDVVAGSATDGLIEKLGLTVLEDDRGFFPPYDAAPVYRPEVLRRYPALEAVLVNLGGQIDERIMRRLNFAVDGERRSEQEVAARFLAEKGLLPR